MLTVPQVISIIKSGHPHDVQAFDGEFEADIESFAAHLSRCYFHLHDVLTAPENEKPPHTILMASYLLDGTNSLMAGFSALRQGYPIQGLDLARRVVETTSVAVYVSDNPSIATGPKLYQLSPSKSVKHAKKHMRHVGQAYGFFSQFDHAHSAIFAVHPLFSGSDRRQQAGFPLGPCSVGDKRPLFTIACLRLLTSAHNLEGVVEMLLFWTLRGQKRYWVPVENRIEYRPIDEEVQCESRTAARLQEANSGIEDELKKLEKHLKAR